MYVYVYIIESAHEPTSRTMYSSTQVQLI